MSKKRERLIHRQYKLVESSAQLRAELLGLEKALIKIAKRLENGDTAVSAGHGVGAPGRRQKVTECIEQFEASRHQLRLALFSVSLEEGATISDLGRVLGISRQLASRIAAEATRGES
jgi:hypothetical protein